MATKAGYSQVKRRSSLEQQKFAAPPKKAGLVRVSSTQIMPKQTSRRSSLGMMEAPPVLTKLYVLPPEAAEVPRITVRYQCCEYTIRPRPQEFYTLLDRLQLAVLFAGEPVMTYTDLQGKLRYVTDPHEMARAYRDFPDHLIVDLRFD